MRSILNAIRSRALELSTAAAQKRPGARGNTGAGTVYPERHTVPASVYSASDHTARRRGRRRNHAMPPTTISSDPRSATPKGPCAPVTAS